MFDGVVTCWAPSRAVPRRHDHCSVLDLPPPVLTDLDHSLVHVVVIEGDPECFAADAGTSAHVLCSRAGFLTFTTNTGVGGRELAERIRPDVIVLDRGVIDHEAVLRHLRARQNCPILVVGGTDSDPTGLPADDLVDTIARMVAARRRMDDVDDSTRFGDLVLDLQFAQAFTSGRPVKLAPRLFYLLAALVRESGAPLGVDDLTEVIGGPSDRRSLQRTMSTLRRSLRVAGSEVAIISTGMGYRVAVDV